MKSFPFWLAVGSTTLALTTDPLIPSKTTSSLPGTGVSSDSNGASSRVPTSSRTTSSSSSSSYPSSPSSSKITSSSSSSSTVASGTGMSRSTGTSSSYSSSSSSFLAPSVTLSTMSSSSSGSSTSGSSSSGSSSFNSSTSRSSSSGSSSSGSSSSGSSSSGSSLSGSLMGTGLSHSSSASISTLSLTSAGPKTTIVVTSVSGSLVTSTVVVTPSPSPTSSLNSDIYLALPEPTVSTISTSISGHPEVLFVFGGPGFIAESTVTGTGTLSPNGAAAISSQKAVHSEILTLQSALIAFKSDPTDSDISGLEKAAAGVVGAGLGFLSGLSKGGSGGGSGCGGRFKRSLLGSIFSGLSGLACDAAEAVGKGATTAGGLASNLAKGGAGTISGSIDSAIDALAEVSTKLSDVEQQQEEEQKSQSQSDSKSSSSKESSSSSSSSSTSASGIETNVWVIEKVSPTVIRQGSSLSTSFVTSFGTSTSINPEASTGAKTTTTMTTISGSSNSASGIETNVIVFDEVYPTKITSSSTTITTLRTSLSTSTSIDTKFTSGAATTTTTTTIGGAETEIVAFVFETTSANGDATVTLFSTSLSTTINTRFSTGVETQTTTISAGPACAKRNRTVRHHTSSSSSEPISGSTTDITTSSASSGATTSQIRSSSITSTSSVSSVSSISSVASLSSASSASSASSGSFVSSTRSSASITTDPPTITCRPDGAPWYSPTSWCVCGQATYPVLTGDVKCAYTATTLTISPKQTSSAPTNIPGVNGLPGCAAYVSARGTSAYCMCNGTPAPTLVPTSTDFINCAYTIQPTSSYNPVIPVTTSSTAPAPPYATGRCNVHIWEGLGTEWSDPAVFMHANITDAHGVSVGTASSKLKWGDALNVQGKLPHQMSVTAKTGIGNDKRSDEVSSLLAKRIGVPAPATRPLFERGPVDFVYGTQKWDTSSSQCSVGKFDNGNANDFFGTLIFGDDFTPNRQMDCRFDC